VNIVLDLPAETRTLGSPARHYIDEAKTGRAVAGRAQLKQLIADAKAGLISKVCVWRFSRIGRNLADSAGIIQELEDQGVSVVSAMEGADPLVRSIFLGMAEHYSKELSSNTRDGLIARFRQKGVTGGQVPFGFQIVVQDGVKRLAVCEPESAVIRQIVEIYLRENIGLKALGHRLEKLGLPTRKGARWCHTTVRSILLNPLLVGKVQYLRRQMKLNRETGRRVPTFRGEADVLAYEDPSLRILTDEQFAQVGTIISSRKPRGDVPRMPRSIRAFTGLVFCAECGTACYSCKSHNSKGTYHYLTCGNRSRFGPSGCPGAGRIREDRLLDAIREDFDAIFEGADQLVRAAVERAKELSRSHLQDVTRLRVEIGEIDRRVAGLMTLMTNPDFDASAVKTVSRQVGELGRQRECLHEAMGRLAQEAGETTEKLAAAVKQAMGEARASLAAIAGPAELNRFVDRFVGPIEIRGDGVFQQKVPGKMLSHPTGDIALTGFEPATSRL
jgi:DNA invertase Pin-like site-specific DNA recombinase